MTDEKQRQAESDGFADGIENVVWRADRHPVECRESYEKGFQRGQIKRRKESEHQNLLALFRCLYCGGSHPTRYCKDAAQRVEP